MSIAAKHFDPQLGIDIHMYAVPPCPLPTPHIGLVLDPFDYIPFIGSTIKVNGVHRGTAGTGGLDIHIPLGVWGPPLAAPMGPQFDGEEIFMGSRTVSADGEPFSRLAMPVLDCNLAGMINPFRMKKPKKPLRAMSLPTGLNVAIPSSVKVGGPPTVSWTALAFRAAFAGLGKLRKSAFFRKKMDAFANWRRGKWGNLPSGFLKCKVLRAEPVDIRDGSVVVNHQDFDVPGRLPLTWQRSYGSRHAGAPGLCGAGWQTPADIRLELLADGSVWLSGPDQVAFFPELPPAEGEAGAILDFVDGARLLRRRGQWRVRFKNGLQYVFGGELPAGVSALPNPQSWPIERIEDAHGNHWRFERRDGHLVRIVESGIGDLQGRFIEVEARHGRIDRMALHDPATGLVHPLVSYRYSGEGDLLAAVDALGAPRTFAYEQHRMVRHTDRVGLSFHYAFDAQGRVVHSWGDGGLYDYHFEYDELLRETRVTDSLGHLSVVKFDENQLPLCEIDPLDGVTLFEYDDFGRTVAVTDPEGLRTAFAYDAHGNVVELLRADGSRILHEYGDLDLLTAVHVPDSGTWTQSYNEFGDIVAQTDPLGAVTEFAYDAAGQLLQQTSARGGATRLAYDRHGAVASVISATGREVKFEHDGRGLLMRQVDAGGNQTQFRYDLKGRLTECIEPDGRSVAYSFDAEDRISVYIDALGNRTVLEYTGLGQVSRRRSPDGSRVEYFYDTEECLVGLINSDGQRYEIERDPLGRIVKEIDYWGQARSYGYDGAGRLKECIDPEGRVVRYTSDKLGRVSRRSVVCAGYIEEDYFTYDACGNLIECGNASRIVKRVFDAVGNLVEESQDGFRVRSSFDRSGNRVRRSTSTGNTIEFAYDLDDELVTLAINGERCLSVARDESGRVIEEKIGRFSRYLQYDPSSNVSSQAVRCGDAPLFDVAYEYDRAGNLIRRMDSVQGTDQYRYNALGRLKQRIDPQGRLHNLLDGSSASRLKTDIRRHAPAKRVGGAEEDELWTREGVLDGVSYVFDRNGALVCKRSLDGGRHLELTWDGHQRLIAATVDGSRWVYGYDSLGRRAFKSNGKRTVWFFWDANVLLSEVEEVSADGGRIVAEPGRRTSLVESRRRQRRLAALSGRAREYVHYPDGFIPFAMVDPKTELDAADGSRGREGEGQAARRPRLELLQSTAPVQAGDHGALGMLGGAILGGAKPKDASTGMILGSAGSQLGAARAGPSRDVGAPVSAPDAEVAAAKVHYFFNDLNGRPVRLLDADGTVLWERAAGASLSDQPSVRQIAVNLGYQGQYVDEETGLCYNRHRYFDPAIDEFVSQDPMRLAAGENLYAYALNPFGWADPLGLHSTQVDYGSTDLSQMAQMHRLENDIKGGRNIAVFEYVDGAGNPSYIVDASGGGLHSERRIAAKLTQMNIPPENVKRVYTELAPCPPVRGMQYCGRMLSSVFPGAAVTHSFDYGVTRASRRSGVKALKAAVRKLFNGCG
ncbi:RHS repeat-associated core domain-containing protein [Stenotrophomonas maltophilia]|uniref:RHS repeat-associated core domain-containing protein n=1 Tax=Stenotrophomonas maltophilia TaxID=40324 RepID=UPI0028958533|nr:RHS repeat-associated core domain-containing protein [Stenotrophomonas maltophilia]MDT3500495.1 RHS repeat-associated core domain-containing protein [Stenotrophomonas maltophilia]